MPESFETEVGPDVPFDPVDHRSDGPSSHLSAPAVDTSLIPSDNEKRILSAIGDLSEDIVYSTDIEGNVRTWNRGAQARFGYTPEEVIGRPVTMLAPADRQHEAPQSLEQIRCGLAVPYHETVRVHKDGTPVDIRMTIVPIRADDDTVIGAVGIARDITERKRAVRALSESEARFRRLAENAPDIIYRYVLDPAPAFEYVSPAIERVTGYAPAAFYADPDLVRRLVHADDHPILERAMVGRDVERLREPIVVRWLHALGHELWVEQHNVPVLNASGELIAIEGIVRDVTARKRAEQEVRETHDRLQLALRAGNTGLFDLDLRTGIAQISPEYALMLGYDGGMGEITIERWRSLLHPGDAGRVTIVFNDVAAGRRDGWEMEYRLRTQAGDHRWVLSTGRVVEQDGAGSPVRMIGTHTDLTQVREAERARREIEDRHWALFETMAQGVIYTGSAGEVMAANPAAERMLGFTLDALRERTMFDSGLVAWREDGTRVAPEDCPAQVAFRTGREIDGVVLGLDHARDRRRRWVLLHCRPQYRPGESKPYQVTTTFTDITALRAAQDALRESEEKFRAIIENSPDIIARFDRELHCVYVSPSLTRATPWRPEDFLDRRPGDLRVPEAFAVPLMSAVRSVLETGQAREESVSFETMPNGAVQHFLLRAYGELDAAGHVRAVLVSAHDITARRALEDQLLHAQRLEAVGRLAGGVAHDFNNLLTGIRGYATFLLAALDADDARRSDAVEIEKAVDRAAALTRQLLAFSRRQILQPQVLDLAAVIRDLQNMLGRIIGEDVELRIRIDPVHGLVLADRGQIEQVLLNLAVNARDAMPRGGKLEITLASATITIPDERWFGELGPGEYVVVTVTDTGHGIPENVRAHIFEPFFTTKDAAHGTGLGLSTVYGIVRQSGGHISVYSEEGHGSTFRIYLPPVDQEGEAATSTGHAESTVSVPPAIATGRETLLFVEDDELVRTLATRALRAAGYSVIVASSGDQALGLAAASAGNIRLLLTDIMMPGMNGRELADQLIRRDPDMGVIFMSGYTDGILGRQGDTIRAAAFLEKPFTPEELTRKVRQMLDAQTTR